MTGPIFHVAVIEVARHFYPCAYLFTTWRQFVGLILWVSDILPINIRYRIRNRIRFFKKKLPPSHSGSVKLIFI